MFILSVAAVCNSAALPTGNGADADHPVLRRIRALREAGDFTSARAMAERFLARNVPSDLLAHRVYFEYARTWFDEADYDRALEEFDALIADFAECGFDERDRRVVLDDAQFFIGRAFFESGGYEEALRELHIVAEVWPDGDCVSDALRWANRAMIEQEIVARRAYRADKTADPPPWNLDAIEETLDLLSQEHSDHPATLSAMEDAVHYFVRRGVCDPEAIALGTRRIPELAAEMRALAPDTRETARATLVAAARCRPEIADEALGLIDGVVETALAIGDARLRYDAEFQRGCTLLAANRGTEARRVFEALADAPPNDAEQVLRIMLGVAYKTEGRLQAAAATFAAVAGDASADPANRASAQFQWAMSISGDRSMQIALLDDLIERYPDTPNARHARRFRDMFIQMQEDRRRQQEQIQARLQRLRESTGSP